MKNFFTVIKHTMFFPFFIILSGCATIVHGRTQQVLVSTNPPEAFVSDGTNTLQTPATLELKRDKDYLLTISKPGYATETVQITHVLNAMVAGNILVGGLIGWGVDAVSGAHWRLVPETVSVTLNPLSDGEATQAPLISQQTQ
jgi:hypothetical protein